MCKNPQVSCSINTISTTTHLLAHSNIHCNTKSVSALSLSTRLYFKTQLTAEGSEVELVQSGAPMSRVQYEVISVPQTVSR